MPGEDLIDVIATGLLGRVVEETTDHLQMIRRSLQEGYSLTDQQVFFCPALLYYTDDRERDQ